MTVSRRRFLAGSAAICAGQLTTGCSVLQQPELKVQILEGSLPVQLLKRFRQLEKQQGRQGRFKFVPLPSFPEGFRVLQYWHRDQDAYQRGLIKLPFRSGKRPVDWMSLGDSWLTGAIRQQLIEPLQPQDWSEWETLPPQWRSLVQRNDQGLPDPQGQVWAAPYRGGSTVIAYRKNRLEELGLEIRDWEDLWQEKLKGHISLLDQPREVIGLGLKSLGQSYNSLEPSKVEGLRQKLGALHRQVKLYDSGHYLQPLLLEDTWVAVGWSGDLLPLLQRDRHLKLVYPQSGTALWADLWVRPQRNASSPPLTDSPLADDWINFFWQPEVAQLITQFSEGLSPRALVLGDAPWMQSLAHREILLPEGDRLRRSEFIQPLPQASLDDYQQLWAAMRSGKLS